MTAVWALAALWFGLALIASLLSMWFCISTALSEIIVGMIAQFIFAATIGADVLGVTEPWVKFLAGVGAIILTFMAGEELDPQVCGRRQRPLGSRASFSHSWDARRRRITCSDGK